MCEEYTSNQGCVLRSLFGWHLYVQLCANMLQIAAHGWFARVQNVVEVFLLRSLFAGFPVCTRVSINTYQVRDVCTLLLYRTWYVLRVRTVCRSTSYEGYGGK